MSDTQNGCVALNVRRIGHLDIPGGGQVTVQDKAAFVGHVDPPHGTSIVDLSDVSRPKILSTLEVPPQTHSHKVRVSGGWLPGQWLAGGENPYWGYERYECHHPMRFGNRLYVSYADHPKPDPR